MLVDEGIADDEFGRIEKVDGDIWRRPEWSSGIRQQLPMEI